MAGQLQRRLATALPRHGVLVPFHPSAQATAARTMVEKKRLSKLAVSVAALNGLISMVVLWHGIIVGHNLGTAISVLFFGGLAVHAYGKRYEPFKGGFVGIA